MNEEEKKIVEEVRRVGDIVLRAFDLNNIERHLRLTVLSTLLAKEIFDRYNPEGAAKVLDFFKENILELYEKENQEKESAKKCKA